MNSSPIDFLPKFQTNDAANTTTKSASPSTQTKTTTLPMMQRNTIIKQANTQQLTQYNTTISLIDGKRTKPKEPTVMDKPSKMIISLINNEPPATTTTPVINDEASKMHNSSIQMNKMPETQIPPVQTKTIPLSIVTPVKTTFFSKKRQVKKSARIRKIYKNTPNNKLSSAKIRFTRNEIQPYQLHIIEKSALFLYRHPTTLLLRSTIQTNNSSQLDLVAIQKKYKPLIQEAHRIKKRNPSVSISRIRIFKTPKAWYDEMPFINKIAYADLPDRTTTHLRQLSFISRNLDIILKYQHDLRIRGVDLVLRDDIMETIIFNYEQTNNKLKEIMMLLLQHFVTKTIDTIQDESGIIIVV